VINSLSNIFTALLYTAGVIGLFIVIAYMLLLVIGFMYGDDDDYFDPR